MLFGGELWWSWRRVLLVQGLPGPLTLRQCLFFVRVIFVPLPPQVNHWGCIKTACVSECGVIGTASTLSLALCKPTAPMFELVKKKEVGLSVMIRREGSFKSPSDDYQERWSGLNIHLLSGLGLLGQFILLPTLIELFPPHPSYPLALKIWTKVARLH